ncbi:MULTISPECIES: hypothetical protein [unclassified Mesorhizobium]|uniref:hypothetical protein n=1 Tax=unclassified Mesorhizobium TaxID=325217 RepID=UPI000FE3FC6A|nr:MULTISPECIES: hypothetical protein [unclassified Mesorhizobium]RWA60928.1 MAG: hypothetical protein EOQ27_20415 [Mesorhizobium sp.]RWX63392.1 hypothetical protein EN780_23870 [Mesorhizobium sp. M4B.F.Ca.ET.089.01.1.1]
MADFRQILQLPARVGQAAMRGRKADQPLAKAGASAPSTASSSSRLDGTFRFKSSASTVAASSRSSLFLLAELVDVLGRVKEIDNHVDRLHVKMRHCRSSFACRLRFAAGRIAKRGAAFNHI